MARYALDGDVITENGRPVAAVLSHVDSDTGVRLVGALNLADRDEQLLDELGERITSRNQT